jgi:hypothetical protein
MPDAANPESPTGPQDESGAGGSPSRREMLAGVGGIGLLAAAVPATRKVGSLGAARTSGRGPGAADLAPRN